MAARNETIVLSADPKGVFIEGYVSGTPKPGTMMEVQTPFHKDGVHLWRVYQPGTDGERRPVVILREDILQGKGVGDAYVSGSRCFLYAPAMGEELNVLYKNVAGTADDLAAGTLLIADSGTGLFIATTGTVESEPFLSLAAITDPTADELVPALYTGY